MTQQFLAVLWLFLLMQRAAMMYETKILHKPREQKEKADEKDRPCAWWRSELLGCSLAVVSQPGMAHDYILLLSEAGVLTLLAFCKVK